MNQYDVNTPLALLIAGPVSAAVEAAIERGAFELAQRHLAQARAVAGFGCDVCTSLCAIMASRLEAEVEAYRIRGEVEDLLDKYEG